MKNSDSPICRDCERLWQAYQRATNEHLRLLSEAHHSISPLTPQDAERLIDQVSAAELSRKTARAALDAHRLDTGHE